MALPDNDTIWEMLSTKNNQTNKPMYIILLAVDSIEVLSPDVYEVNMRSGFRFTTNKINGDALINKLVTL